MNCRTARIGRRDVIKEKDTKKKVELPGVLPGIMAVPPRRRSSSGTGGSEESSDRYGLSQLFQPDNAPSEASGELDNSVRTKFKVNLHTDTSDVNLRQRHLLPEQPFGVCPWVGRGQRDRESHREDASGFCSSQREKPRSLAQGTRLV